MTSVKSANAVPTVQQQSSVLNLEGAERKPSLTESRSSLDVPRLSSPWETSNDDKGSPRPKSPPSQLPSKPIARLRGPGITLRQRPLLTEQPSPPPKPPVKPRSRNPSPSKLAQQTGKFLTPKVLALYVQSLSYGGTSLLFIQSLEHTRLDSSPISKEAGPVANVPPPIADRGIRKDFSYLPPANRAEKPKPPSKPPMVHSSQGKPSLETILPEDDGRQSPFSTPLSSMLDDCGIGSLKKPLGFEEPAPRVDNLPTVTTAKFSKEVNPELKNSLLVGFEKPLRAIDKVEDPNDEHRPGLPPRPTQGLPNLSTRRSEDGRKLSTTNNQQIRSQLSLPATQLQLARSVPPPTNLNNQESKKLSTRQLALPRPSSPSSGFANRPAINTNGQQHDDAMMRGSSPCGTVSALDYPDTSRSNRRPPRAHRCASAIETKYETRLFDACGKYVCATGYLTRAWDVATGELVFQHTPDEKETKVTSIAFKSGGAAEDEGKRLWLGTNFGELYEVHIPEQEVVHRKPGAHTHREIIKLYRYENHMWSLDDDGRFHVWPPDDSGSPSLLSSPQVQRLPKGHTFSMVVNGHLWLATGKDIRIYNPNRITEPSFQVTQSPISQRSAGDITSGAVISSQIDRVYFGHADGKVTAYSTQDYTCLGIFNVSAYKINCMAGAGFYLWAGFNTGMIYVYDTRAQPWLVKKDWLAHENPVSGMVVDRTSVWKFNRLHVVSMGMDNVVRIWDGLLEEDWLGKSPTR